MQLLADGLALLVMGMGSVFAFLAIMVVCIIVSSRLVARWSHLLPETAPAKPSRRPRPAAVTEDTDLVVAITAAIHRYRQKHRG